MEELILDGNAAAGLLAQIFVPDMTSALARCAHCQASAALGAVALYQGAGSVLRCRNCEGVLLRVVSAPDRTYIELTGIRCLELPLA